MTDEKKPGVLNRFVTGTDKILKDFATNTSNTLNAKNECKAWLYGTKECSCSKCKEYEEKKAVNAEKQ